MQLNHFQLQQCKIQAKLFALAYGSGYDPRAFVAAFMDSAAAEGLDADYDRMQWAGEEYILQEVVESAALAKSPSLSDVSAEALFWAGYLYRYWHFLTGEASRRIYAQAPLDVLLDVYPGMHALSPEMAIEDLRSRNHGHVVAEGPAEEVLPGDSQG